VQVGITSIGILNARSAKHLFRVASAHRSSTCQCSRRTLTRCRLQ
jgi:hypothetical protein